MNSKRLSKADWETAKLVSELLAGGQRELPRHPHSLAREVVTDTQRARLLAATATLVEAGGYSNLTVTGITKEAGVSTKTFYESFEHKDDAFLGLYVLLDAAIAVFERAITETDDWQAALDLGVTSYVQMLATGSTVGRVLLIEAFGASPAIRRRRVRALNQFVDAILHAAETHGAPRLDRDLIMGVVGAANELAYQHALEFGPHRFDELETRLGAVIGQIGHALASAAE